MTEVAAMALWAVYAARGVFSSKLTAVIKIFRQGLLPATLLAVGFTSFTQAHSMPGPVASGVEVAAPVRIEARFDGISLDEAVSRAEAQYRARVVRTDVQDEDGRKVYVLKLLSEGGRVFTVRIDAATGRMR